MGCCGALPGLVRHPQDPARRRLSSASPRSCRSSHAGPALRLCLSLLSPLSLLPQLPLLPFFTSLLSTSIPKPPFRLRLSTLTIIFLRNTPKPSSAYTTPVSSRAKPVASPSSNAPCTLASPPAPRRRQSINSIESRHADVPFFLANCVLRYRPPLLPDAIFLIPPLHLHSVDTHRN